MIGVGRPKQIGFQIGVFSLQLRRGCCRRLAWLGQGMNVLIHEGVPSTGSGPLLLTVNQPASSFEALRARSGNRGIE